jgi:nodulation protein E
MKNTRVVVSGVGVISALGNNQSEFWSRLVAGESGIRPIEQVDCSDMRFKCGGEVKDYVGEDYFSAKQINWLDRFSQFAVISAGQAIKDAKLTAEDFVNTQTAVITGSCLGGAKH